MTSPTPATFDPVTSDRRVGALAHLGVPLYSFILPLVIWAVSESKPFRRAHARQAFSFQCVFLVPYIVAVGLVASGTLGALVLAALIGVGLVLEVPQVVRALAGGPPHRIVPVEILP